MLRDFDDKNSPLGIPVDDWLIKLDEDHLLHPFVNAGSTETAGYFVAFRHADGFWCTGTVTLKGMNVDGRPEWDQTSKDPITLTPSILQRGGDCSHHGYVTDGKWIEV